MKNRFVLTLAALAGGVAVSTASAQPTLTNIGSLGARSTFAFGVDAGGETVAVERENPQYFEDQITAYLWSGGVGVDVGQAPNSVYIQMTKLSRDGQAMAGRNIIAVDPFSGDAEVRPMRWTEGSEPVELTMPAGASSGFATGVSNNGLFTVGSLSMATQRGVLWSGDVPEVLALPAGATASTALGISADGTTVVGGYVNGGQRIPYKWTRETGMQALPRIGNTGNASAYMASHDGSVIAGTRSGGAWVYRNGEVSELPTPAGTTRASVFDMSADGAVIAGEYFIPGTGNIACIWRTDLGRIDLNTYLPSVGIDTAGWTFVYAMGVSDDGSTVVGRGSYNGDVRAFLVTGLPGTCAADFNNDGFLDFFDYDDFVNCFEGTCAPGQSADFNRDGFADFFDYDDFVQAFESGC